MHWLVTVLILGVGVVQLPMLVDALVLLLPSTGLRRLTQASLARLLFVVVLALCGAALTAFYMLFLPADPLPRVLHAGGITYVWLLTLDNYWHAVSLRPPPAAIAARRVPGFDHICPFTMNHVWRGNFPPFYAFLACASLGTLYAAVVSWPLFARAWLWPLLPPAPGSPPLSSQERALAAEERPVALVFLAAVGLCQAIGGLFLFQTFLLWRSWTTAGFFRVAQAGGGLGLFLRRCAGRVPCPEADNEVPLPAPAARSSTRGRTMRETHTEPEVERETVAQAMAAALAEGEAAAALEAEAEAEAEAGAEAERVVTKWELLQARPLWAYALPPSLLPLLGIVPRDTAPSADADADADADAAAKNKHA